MARAPQTPKTPAGDPPPTGPERLKRVNRNPEFEASFGARIRAARVAARMSQGALGNAIGISWQQVQKYEKGVDRVAVGTLQIIASTLGVHPGSFFDADEPLPTPAPRSTVADWRNAQRIGERIERLGDPTLIRRLMALVDAIKGATNDAAVDVDRTSDDDQP